MVHRMETLGYFETRLLLIKVFSLDPVSAVQTNSPQSQAIIIHSIKAIPG